VISQEEFVVR